MAGFCILICCFSAFAIYSAECSIKAFDSNVQVNIQVEGIKLQQLNSEEFFDKTSNKARIIHRFGNRITGEYNFIGLSHIIYTMN